MSAFKENFVITGSIAVVLVLAGAYTWSVVKDREITALSNSQAGVSLSTDEKTSPYTDLNGDPVALSDYVGEILVVNSWASWCPFCKTELEELSGLAAEYSDEDIRILAINRAEPATTAQRFLRNVKTTSEILLILDNDDRYYKSIEGYTMPETVFYDRKGNIVKHHHGDMTVSQMKEYIDEAVKISKAKEGQ